MEKAQDIPPIPEPLTPPEKANISMVLNGAGNGMMLGAAPFILAEMAEGITKNNATPFKIPSKMHMLGAATTVIGAIFGGVYGRFESNELNKYRLEIGKEIAKLNTELKHLKGNPQGWAAKIEAEQTTPTTDITR